MILDVGCGLSPVGDINMDREVYSDETGRQVWRGIFSREKREKFRTCLNVRGVGDAIPFKDDTFPVVWSSDSIEHTETPAKFLEELIRVSNGLVVVVTPHYWAKDSDIPIHRSRFKRRDFDRMLRSSEYSISWRYHTTLGYLCQWFKFPLFRPRRIILHIFKNPVIVPTNTFMGFT